MRAYERLLNYVRVYTTSDPESGTHPSAAREFDLAHQLVGQVKFPGGGRVRTGFGIRGGVHPDIIQKSFISAHKRHTPLFVDWKIVFANIQSLSYPLFRFLTTFFAHKTIKIQRFNSFLKKVHAKDVSVCRCDPGCKKASQQRPQALLRCFYQNIFR